MNRHPVGPGPWRRWKAFRSERRHDRTWAHAIARAATPSMRQELLVLRSIAAGAHPPGNRTEERP